ncbi:MAG: hypothetical protein EA426_12895 [Spirochaetaceae bacterium]|nr:MAG: hypothetical protein EA426_12895 [Spirochaetaceae bacterium]
MDLNLKVGAYSAVAAFVLSAIAGAVGGVPFGILLFRAVIGAVVFGAGAIGVDILVDNVLPELKENPDVPSEMGGNVDIVVSDDVGEDADSNANKIDQAGHDGEGDEDEDEEDDPLVQEVEELSADDAPTNGAAGEIDADIVNDTIDDLPEIGGFAESFRSGRDDSSGFDGESGSAASGGKDTDAAGDARVMAKALQTIMKRDD